MQTIRKALIVTGTVILILSGSVVNASVGQIVGTIFDEKNGDPLIGASVQVEGTAIGAACDIDGRYVIKNVPQGTHTLLIASVGYTPKRIVQVAVTNGEPVIVDATLSESVTELKPVVVERERAKATESAVLMKRKAAVSVTDGMSGEMIKKAGDANAGDALRRVVGVSVVDGRKLVVRGMGGRYSSVVLNGAPLPSPEPEKKEVPLDLFPAALLDEVTTSKTFTPDKPGSFSGGLVDLATKEFPSRLSYNVSYGRSYNSESTGKGMYFYPGGDIDWLGFDDGTRDMPAEVAAGNWGRVSGDTAAMLRNEKAGESLSDVWTPEKHRARPSQSFGGSLGNTYLMGESSKLGILASLSYNDSYKVRREEHLFPGYYDFTLDRGTQSILWGSLLNVTYAAGERNKLAVKGLYTRAAEDEAFVLHGLTAASGSDEAEEDRLKFAQRYIGTLQLSGEHKVGFPFESTIGWRAQRSWAGTDEPDTRSNKWTIYEGYKSLQSDHYSGLHLFQLVDDDEAHGAFDWTIPLSSGVNFKSGLFFQNRTRLQTVTRVRLYSQGQAPQSPSGEVIFTDSTIGIGRNQYYLDNLTFPDDPYDVTEHTFAQFVQLQADLLPHLRMISGARREDYTLTLHTGDRTTPNGRISVDRDNEDWMPMASLIYSFSDESPLHGVVVRGVVSRTVSRPEFRELAPFYYFDIASSRPTYGNATLVRSRIMNYDLRTEFFPSPGEVIALSVFAKHFQNPIEQVVVSGQSTPENSYKNQKDAQTYGFELEARRQLSFLAGSLSSFSLGGNVTRSFGEVTVDVNLLTVATERRPLQDQSAWSGNAFLSYGSVNGGTDVTLNFNAFSRRLRYVDKPELEDWYQEPQNMLDLVISQRLPRNVTVKFAAKNLLGAKYKLTQDQGPNSAFPGQRLTIEQYDLGQTYTLGFSYGI